MGAAWSELKRLLSGQWWPSGATPSWQDSSLVIGVLAGVVALLGLADYATGPVLSLALFYLVPIALGTAVAGRRAGFALALESGAATTTASFLTKSHDNLVYVLNGVLLLLTLSVLVVLIAAARETALVAGESARQRREFLAYAAHQLRTPVAGIRASTDALLVGGATPQQERLLLNLSREAERAGKLLSSLLQMARVDQGEVPPPLLIDVVELCRGELDRRRPGTSVATELVVRGEHPDRVVLSGEATKNALANLLDNARRHARGRVTIEITATPSIIAISVGDDGPGLPEGTSERVFERFVSLDGEGGSGLGLPIARGLIEAQGGRLTYENHRFVIRLPNRRRSTTTT
jgi:signal transduction histidine kinase